MVTGKNKTETKQEYKAESQPKFIQLKELSLPVFNGLQHEWINFYQLFLTSVDANPNYGGAQKLQYLKSFLSGEAANIISSIPITDAAYKEALELLKTRYNNKKELAYAQLDRFHSIKKMSNESASELRKIIDTTNEVLRSLKSMELPTDKWDVIIVHSVCQKLTSTTRREWEMKSNSTDFPTMTNFVEYLEQRAHALAAAASSQPKEVKVEDKKRMQGQYKGKNLAAHHSGATLECAHCNEEHHIRQCDAFKCLSVPERKQVMMKMKLCGNCLGFKHIAKNCKSRGVCAVCKSHHHTLLHEQRNNANTTQVMGIVEDKEPVQQNTNESVQAHLSSHREMHKTIMLATTIVHVTDAWGNEHKCRLLLDQGSQGNFVSESCVARLGLKRRSTKVTVTGLGAATVNSVRGSTTLKLNSRFSSFILQIEAFILPKVTGLIPKTNVDVNCPHLRKIQLSDEGCGSPGEIDILIGAEHVAALFTGKIIKGPINSPTAQETNFGWVLSGPVATTTRDIQVHHGTMELNETLKKFWKLEEPYEKAPPQTDDDEICEQHFTNTHKRTADGRFIVELPFKDFPPSLGDSREIAMKRFLQLEKRLTRNPSLHHQYTEAINKLLDDGHMVDIEEEETSQKNQVYYLPHHPVIKESSTTTCRIVYDSSCATTNGLSLNNVLRTGPNIQKDLILILMKFCTYKIPMVADVMQMYLQTLVHPPHTNYQRIFWRNNIKEQVKAYKLTRVTFGMSSSPFLAIRCLKQLAEEHKNKFPRAAEVIQEEFLVDNMLTGADSEEEAIKLQAEILEIMEAGCLTLRKWASTSNKVLQQVPPEMREVELPFDLNPDSTIKTLGIYWSPQKDEFSYKINLPDTYIKSTKRQTLSVIARVYDPICWLAPVTIRGKLIMQELWKLKTMKWDDFLPEDIQEKWTKYCQDLVKLESLRIPRCTTDTDFTGASSSREFHLHGFSDASKDAYSACVYLHTRQGDRRSTRLVVAKTKVSPLKLITIPRLELCGALLLAQLMTTAKEALQFQFTEIKCWTDSMVVLEWIYKGALERKKDLIFIDNRVQKIIALMPAELWGHVNGDDNPADCASRGISSKLLIQHKKWWEGPSFLQNTETQQQQNIVSCAAVKLLKQGPTRDSTKEQDEYTFNKIIERYSSLDKMKRVTAYCLRFIGNLKKPTKRKSGPLSVDELQKALNILVRKVQEKYFPEEIEDLKKGKTVKSNMKFLSPFLDHNNIIRVGGRLENSDQIQKHPMIIPRHGNFTTVVLQHFHVKNLHAGPLLLLATIRTQFWIQRGGDAVRYFVRKCVVCHRHQIKNRNQLMGQLPFDRVQPGKPFSHSGVDYAGPFNLIPRVGRGQQSRKYYVALFVCLKTRAVHLELVGDASTPAFQAAFTRFISTRGQPTILYSDGGLNFVGANNEMKEFLSIMNSEKHANTLKTVLAGQGTDFQFNPPRSPHMGGLWEANIKSMKYHLSRIMGTSEGNLTLSIEEMSTLIKRVEACLNSRPISPMTADPSDLTYLTPGHFLTGATLTAPPELRWDDTPMNRLSRWQLVQKLQQDFWKRWSRDYIRGLQNRPKWYAPQPNLKIGDLVLLRDKDDELGPLQWKLARIHLLHPGTDGRVRVCTIKTASLHQSTGKKMKDADVKYHYYKRPIVKLSPLPIDY